MKKYFISMMSVLLIVVFYGLALADPIADPTGDHIATVDLLVAQAEVYDRADTNLLKLSIETDPHLPGIVIFESDVDNSTGTGGSLSMTGIPVAPCPCKTSAGFDISILTVIRQQGDASQTAFCEGCVDATPPNPSH